MNSSASLYTTPPLDFRYNRDAPQTPHPQNTPATSRDFAPYDGSKEDRQRADQTEDRREEEARTPKEARRREEEDRGKEARREEEDSGKEEEVTARARALPRHAGAQQHYSYNPSVVPAPLRPGFALWFLWPFAGDAWHCTSQVYSVQ